MQNSVGDTIQIHKSTVCRTVRRVALALCTHMYDFVYMLVDNKKLNDTRLSRRDWLLSRRDC